MAYNSDYTFSFELEEQVKRATAELRLLRAIHAELDSFMEGLSRGDYGIHEKIGSRKPSRFYTDSIETLLAAYQAWQAQQAQGSQ